MLGKLLRRQVYYFFQKKIVIFKLQDTISIIFSASSETLCKFLVFTLKQQNKILQILEKQTNPNRAGFPRKFVCDSYTYYEETHD